MTGSPARFTPAARARPAALRGIALIVVGLLALAACTGRDDTAVETTTAGCERRTAADVSVARLWDEVLLDAIRRDFPAPTVHSRNLFHLSAAMWDAWAAYDPVAAGYFVDEAHQAEDVKAAREEAMSYAAYRILSHRYQRSVGAEETQRHLEALMAALCYEADVATLEGDTPAALGNRIAAAVIDFGRSDGALEESGYVDAGYGPVNEPMIVDQPGTELDDPNRWQPLALDVMISQNGLPLPFNVQEFVGPHWGNVAGFALRPSPEGLPLDPGDPPYLRDPETDREFKDAAVEVIRFSSLLDPSRNGMIDIGPASLGGNTLGANDGDGYPVNPMTGDPYAANVVPLGDFGRVVAEFWADGPESETPPGHWNTLANAVTDHPDLVRRVGGLGPEVDLLEWDVKLYFVLNAAVHDAAVAAWGAKGYYDYARPISMIRYMGGLGQSSEPEGASYHPDGLPLVPDLVEVITTQSSAPGERHEHLADRVGEIAILAWAGNPDDPEAEIGGVAWIPAVEWVPYQRDTFVTPAFAGYVSGHSTFSRAAADVLTRFTGNAYFPGGLGEWTIPAGGLEFEAGPAEDVTLQWATYHDAADQAGISRLYGGIHVRADDLQGRIMGATCGKAAWELAQRYFDGSIRG